MSLKDKIKGFANQKMDELEAARQYVVRRVAQEIARQRVGFYD